MGKERILYANHKKYDECIREKGKASNLSRLFVRSGQSVKDEQQDGRYFCQ